MISRKMRNWPKLFSSKISIVSCSFSKFFLLSWWILLGSATCTSFNKFFPDSFWYILGFSLLENPRVLMFGLLQSQSKKLIENLKNLPNINLHAGSQTCPSNWRSSGFVKWSLGKRYWNILINLFIYRVS